MRELHVASVADDVISILYERERRLVLATFDRASLSKRGEEALGIPALK